MEMGEVVGTLFHPINGSMENVVMEVECQHKVPLSMNSPAKPILV
jgi:hypothetical protein